jgi:hypothetical protein
MIFMEFQGVWWQKPIIPATLEAEVGRSQSSASRGQSMRPYLKEEEKNKTNNSKKQLKTKKDFGCGSNGRVFA